MFLNMFNMFLNMLNMFMNMLNIFMNMLSVFTNMGSMSISVQLEKAEGRLTVHNSYKAKSDKYRRGSKFIKTWFYIQLFKRTDFSRVDQDHPRKTFLSGPQAPTYVDLYKYSQ